MYYGLVLLTFFISLNIYSAQNISDIVKGQYQLSSSEFLNSKLEVQRTKTNLYSSIASHLPELSFTLGQKRLNEQTGVPPSNYLNSNRRTERSWELDLVFPLFDRTKYLSIQKGLLEKKSASSSHGYLEDQIDWKVKSSLGNIYIQQYKILNLVKSITHFKEILNSQQEGFRLKAKRVIDVEEARSNLLLLKARKTIEENLLVISKEQLAVLLSKSSSYVEELLKDLPMNKDKLLDTIQGHYELDKILTKKINKKLRWEVIEETSNSYKLEEINSKYTQSVHWPKLQIIGSYSKEGASWRDIKDFDNSNRTLGIYLKIPFFQSGKSFSDNKSVNLLIEQSLNKRKYGTRQIIERSKNIKLQFEKEKLRLKILKDHLKSRERLLAAYREAFKLGRETLSELIKQENIFIESQFSLVDSMNNLGSLYYQCEYLYGVTI
ncbi:TolC family protein [Halobacteriovorax sp. HLS]|uniref:TolC family protein n=1 Tax=Halobacteriovorax sp. HLS TaxID=2234000 RepID=UPI000FD80FF3|nr:TolC family protein [Halobacteriovorax sp. HLS]